MTLSDRHTPSGERGQRLADRFASELPIHLNGVDGLTKNVSATGVYFETTTSADPGSKVTFVVEVVIKGQSVNMVCSGQVVRVERQPDKVGVAVKLTSSFFTDAIAVDEVEPDPDPETDDDAS